MATGYGVIYIFLGSAGRWDYMFVLPGLPLRRPEFIRIEHKLRDLPRNMSCQEMDVFFQIRSWHGHSHVLMGKGAADLELIKISTNEVTRPPFRQFRILLPLRIFKNSFYAIAFSL
jgi:hypothetical protein